MRETRSSGSAEGVMGNCDPYSDPSEPMVVMQPKCTVEGADIVMQLTGHQPRETVLFSDVDYSSGFDFLPPCSVQFQ